MEAFLSLRHATEKEFTRGKRLHGRRMKCRVGCDACCHSPFSISEIEAARISVLVFRLDEPWRARILQRARDYLAARRRLFERFGFRESRGALAPESERLACPALHAGRCLIYDERPLLCRRFGGPVCLPQYPDRVFACELNFPRGTTIEDAQLASAQQRLAGKSQELQTRFDGEGGRRHPEPVTVAHALLEDFRDCLPAR